jgi:outer membrane protein assembly factor BamB
MSDSKPSESIVPVTQAGSVPNALDTIAPGEPPPMSAGERYGRYDHNEAALPSSIKKSWRKRWLYPLIVLGVCGSLFAWPLIQDALDMEVAMPIAMMLWWSPPLAVLLLTPWWLFFSGFRRVTRFGIALFLVLGIVGFVRFGIRDVEMDLNGVTLVPVIHFPWEPTQEEKLAQHQESANDLPALDATVGPDDFPAYRGTKRDGVAAFTNLNKKWASAPPQELWRRPCGGGYSGIAVAGNIAVTLELRDKQEVVACYDRATGQERWTYSYSAFHKDVMGNGPRATPVIHNRRIFSLGAKGDLVCLNEKGEHQWSINILTDCKAKNTEWGLSGSPLIVDDLVVVEAGIDPAAPAGAGLAAYDQKTGAKRWHAGNRPAGYSSPQLAVLAGIPQILVFDGAGLVSYEPKTGKELWQSPWVTDHLMNTMQPLVLGDDRVFISSEAANGCALLRVQPPSDAQGSWSVTTVWAKKSLAARFANPVTDGTHIYGLHGVPGILRCLDASNGEIVGHGDRYGAGQMLLMGGTLLIVSDRGVVSLMPKNFWQADPPGGELGRFSAFDDRQKVWNTPALAGDQLFLRNQFEIVCLRLPHR